MKPNDWRLVITKAAVHTEAEIEESLVTATEAIAASLSKAVARYQAAKCPDCGKPGLQHGLPATITYHPGGGIAQASIPAKLYRCTDCGVWFAREEK